MRTLHLYGELADTYGGSHEVAAATIPEALRIVECNHPGFLRVVRKQRFHVATGGVNEEVEMLLHHIFMPTSHGDWHLVPALEGGKSTLKVIFSIVIGGALLATGIGGAIGAGAAASGGALGGASAGLLGAGLSTGVLGLSYGSVALLGASFFLGGISQLLTQTPKGDTGEKKPTSFSFEGPAETDDEGGPLQIIVGEVICSGIRAASAVESTNSASISQYFGSGDGGGGGESSYLDGIYGSKYDFLHAIAPSIVNGG